MLSTILMACMLQGGANAPIVINEVVYDNLGTDDQEFVELYNASKATVDISSWVLDGNDYSGPNSSVTIPANTKLAPGAYYVIGNKAVPNVNLIVAAGFFENSDECIFLVDGSQKVIDAMSYEGLAHSPVWATSKHETSPVWGACISVKTHPTSWSRVRDGVDTGNNSLDYRLMPSTPGKSNDLPRLILYNETFDAATTEKVAPKWGGSFSPPYVIDPTKVSVHNPAAVTASPQGGNAMAIWDPTYNGGLSNGTSGMLLMDTLTNVVMECYVFVDASKHAAGDRESWSIGLRGTGDCYANHPSPLAPTAPTYKNANTGITVTYMRDDKSAILYLIDHNDGGEDPVVLGSLPIQVGKNDGWQRLRFTVAGEHAEAIWGGKIGTAAGSVLYGKLGQGDSKSVHPAVLSGGVYINNRINIAAASTKKPRPLTIDGIRILPTSPRVTFYGKSATGTAGKPSIDTFGNPSLGSASFAITGSELVPSAPSVVVLGAVKIIAGVALPNPLFPKGVTLYVSPLMSFAMLTSTTGLGKLPLPIPADTSLSNIRLEWQLYNLDTKTGAAMPLVSSQGMSTLLGG
jgi:Lamin Tail Domain